MKTCVSNHTPPDVTISPLGRGITNLVAMRCGKTSPSHLTAEVHSRVRLDVTGRSRLPPNRPHQEAHIGFPQKSTDRGLSVSQTRSTELSKNRTADIVPKTPHRYRSEPTLGSDPTRSPRSALLTVFVRHNRFRPHPGERAIIESFRHLRPRHSS